jgi:hypothetical protein
LLTEWFPECFQNRQSCGQYPIEVKL